MAQVQAITAQLKTAPTQPPEQKAAFPPPEQKTAFDKVRFSHHPTCLSYSCALRALFCSFSGLFVFVCGLSFLLNIEMFFPDYTCHAGSL